MNKTEFLIYQRYEVRTYPVPWRLNGRCTEANYGQYPNGTVSILNTVELYGQPAQLLTSALVIGPGILAISGPSNPLDLPNYYVLGTNYNDFAIGHSCRDNGTHAAHFAWVLSRERSLGLAYYQLTNLILTANRVPLSPLVDVDHTNC